MFASHTLARHPGTHLEAEVGAICGRLYASRSR